MYKRRNFGAVVPYGRGRGRRTSYHNKKRYPMYRMNGGSRFRAGAGFKAKVKRAVGAELKFFQFSFLHEVERTGADVSFLSEVPQGTEPTERVGNWIDPQSVHGTIRCHGNPGAGPETWTLRVGILRFNDSLVGQTIIASQLLEDATRPGGPFKVAKKGEFSVLWTRVLIVSNNTDNTLFTRALRYRVDLRSSPKCLYSGPLSSSGTKNHIFFFAMSDAPIPEAMPPTVDLDAMFRYTDS